MRTGVTGRWIANFYQGELFSEASVLWEGPEGKSRKINKQQNKKCVPCLDIFTLGTFEPH